MAAWTDEESQRLSALHAEGKSLTSIANEMQRPKGTVSNWAKTLGLSFDRTSTAKAAEAVHIDNKARRIALEERLLREADKVLDQLWKPAIVFSFGGQENLYSEHELDQPQFGDQKAIMQTAATALNSANKLNEMNPAGRDLPAADAWLAAMTGSELPVESEGT